MLNDEFNVDTKIRRVSVCQCELGRLPPLLCHGANMSRHISVRICLFLPPASSYKAPPQSTRAACLSLKYWNVFTCYIL